MQPAEQIDKYFEVRDSSGAAVTGLVTANFAFVAWHTPYGGANATWTHGSVVSEIGAGRYRVRFALPPAAGSWVFYPTHATHVVTPYGWEDELQVMDTDAVAGLIARPVVRVSGDGTLGEPATLPTLIAYRKAIITIGVLDNNDDPFDFTGYTSWAVGFRSATTQSGGAPRLDAIHGTPAGFGLAVSSGLITITIPDDLTIFGALTEGVTPTEEVTIEMEVVADNPSGQTVSIVAPSDLRIRKRAHGSGS